MLANQGGRRIYRTLVTDRLALYCVVPYRAWETNGMNWFDVQLVAVWRPSERDGWMRRYRGNKHCVLWMTASGRDKWNGYLELV